MRRLILPALMTLAMSVGGPARATMVTVDALPLDTGGPGVIDQVSIAPGALLSFTGVVSGAYTLDFTIKMEAGPGGAVVQAGTGIGVTPGLGGLIDPGQEVTFSLVSATVASGPKPFVVFDGFTDFTPNNGSVVDFMPPLAGPEPVVKLTNVASSGSFGVLNTSLKFTAVPEPSAFMYGGLVAAVAGLGYRGRRWLGAGEAVAA